MDYNRASPNKSRVTYPQDTSSVQNPPTTDALSGETLDIEHYWRLIMGSRWKILIFSLFATAVAAITLLTITPRYVATASLLIEAEETKLLSIEEVYGLDSNRKEYFQTQYEILKSRQIAGLVVDKLNLVEHPLFDPLQDAEQGFSFNELKDDLRKWLKQHFTFLPQSTPNSLTPEQQAAERRRTVISRVTKNLTIKPITNTQVVNIQFESESPKLAATVANAIAEAYIDNYLNAKLEMTNKATAWLSQSIQGLRDKLDQSEQALNTFYQQEQVVDIDGVVGLAAEELQQLSDQLLQAQNALKVEASSFNNIAQFNGNPEALAALPEVLNHPAIQGIKTAEVNARSKLSELSKVYGPKHPKMISAQAELASIMANLRTETSNLVNSLSISKQSQQQTVSQLQQAVEIAKERYRKLTQLEGQRQTLVRNVEVNRQLYDSFFTRMKETSELGGFESANARILDRANPPKIPAKPKKTMLLAGALVLSAGIAIFFIITADALNSGIRSPIDVEQKLNLKLLGAVPRRTYGWWRRKGLPLRHYFDSNDYLFSESVRSLRTNLKLNDYSKQTHVTMVSSSLPNEGKTTVAINLAFSLAQLGSVILIDGDLRSGDIANRFGLIDYQPGLADLLGRTHRIDECVITDEDSEVDIICAGSGAHNPQELLASADFTRLIAALKQNYDYVIIDSPPIQAVADALIIDDLCDTNLFVIKANSTKVKQVLSNLDRFSQLGHTVDGAVLSMYDVVKAQETGDYYGFVDQYHYRNRNNDKPETSRHVA